MTGGRAPVVVVHPDAEVLAAAAGARLVAALADAQATRGAASVVLTGGGVGIALLEAVRTSPARDAVRWDAVDVWWGDERFIDAASDDRNERQARAALLDHVPLDPWRVHPMGASDTFATPEDAAASYLADLARAASREPVGASPVPGGRTSAALSFPVLDVLLLGMGPEGHTASIFPESPASHDERAVFAVRDCPKPPPIRVSLGWGPLTAARQCWMLVAGFDKAPAVARALSGADRVLVPAAGPAGTERTLWLLDREASSELHAA